jgi:DNA-binding CsgD family transcriptional regulator
MYGLMAPRRARTVTTYGVHALDGTRESYALEREQKHREAEGDDPWLSPFKSEAVKALLVTIGAAQAHGLEPEKPPDELDIRGLAEDAGCTKRQVEVFMLTCAGRRQCDIARELGISSTGVWRHLDTARRKLVRVVPPLDVLREIARV